MPLDAVVVSALRDELSQKLIGGRIDKVQQPERDMLLLSLRAGGENLRLLITIGTGSARVQLTRRSMENPSEPPMFCMLMRKHLTGARILSLSQPEHERMLIMELDTHDELGFNVKKQLVIELMGRNSNIILVDAEGRIIDCMRRMDFAGDALRRLLPGMIYRLPPSQNKQQFISADAETFEVLCTQADREMPMDKWLLSSFSGLSPLICREIAYRCNEQWDTLPAFLEALQTSILNREFTPCLVSIDGKPADFSFMNIVQYGSSAENCVCDSFSELLDAFYSKRDSMELKRRRSHELMRSVKSTRDRLERKLAGQREELKRTEDREQVRKTAELITANIYRMKKGERELVCTDYYEPECPEIRIALDPLKTPQQNAAAMYKSYNKLKGAKQHLTVLVQEGERQLEYLNSVLDEIERAETEADLSAIRRELTDTGYIKKTRNAKPEKLKPQQPLRYMSEDGYEILVGRSNAQNDELTGKIARRTDMWLHTQKVHGSHVIVRCEGEPLPERTLEQAASLAVFHSQARDAGKTPVDYTMVRNVRKPSGALPGKVIYTEYKTLLAQGDEKLAMKLKIK